MNAVGTKRLKLWFIPVLLLFAVLAAGLLFQAHQRSAIEVEEISPSLQDMQITVSASGRLVPAIEFDARSSFAGLVQKINVKLGEVVSPGKLLVQMRDPFAASRVAAAIAALQTAEVSNDNIQQGGSQEDRIGLRSDLDRAKAEQAAASNALATIQELAKTGAASGAEVNGARIRLQAAEAALKTISARSTDRYSIGDKASWVARVSEAKTTLKAEKQNYANANITSPIAGTVYLTPVAANDFVPSGADLVRVADLSHLQVIANFDEPDIGKLHNGQPVNVIWDGAPNHVWHGHIVQAPLGAMAAGDRDVGQCIILVDDAKGDLLPNTRVMASAIVESRKGALTIPREALHSVGKDHFVFRVLNGRLMQGSVDIGLSTPERVEITHGVARSDKLVLRAADNTELKQGLKIASAP